MVGSGNGGRSTANAYEAIRRDVLHVLERDEVDPTGDPDGVARTVEQAVAAYQRRAHLGDGRALADTTDMARRILTSIHDFGPLTDLLSSPDVEEVFIEGSQVTFIDRRGRLQGLKVPTTEAENRQVVDRLLATTQRTLDAKSPIVQARVLDGAARLTAAQPPITDRLSATIRRHSVKRETLAALVDRGSLTLPAAGLLWTLVQSRSSVVVAGPPGAGKTTMLSALLAAVPGTQCVRCCEEIRELHVPVTHGGYYETRPPALDGTGEIDLRDLVKFTLAMRPDLIVVGEVRGAEAFELTRAVNAGCGFACTVHANSAREALTALVNAATMAGENVREDVVRRVFSASIDVVVHLDRLDGRDGAGPSREVAEIIALAPSLTDDFTTETLFSRTRPGAPLTWTGALPPNHVQLERALPDGLDLQGILEGRVSPL